eukprot:scaffold2119_cov264-Pinguiococcus_pyrenoidosus.AAC.5
MHMNKRIRASSSSASSASSHSLHVSAPTVKDELEVAGWPESCFPCWCCRRKGAYRAALILLLGGRVERP